MEKLIINKTIAFTILFSCAIIINTTVLVKLPHDTKHSNDLIHNQRKSLNSSNNNTTIGLPNSKLYSRQSTLLRIERKLNV